MKSAKFLIAENPLIDDGRISIIHMRDPVIIAEAFHFEEDQEEEWMDIKRQFNAGASVEYPGELIFLGVNFIAPFKSESSQEGADKIDKIMSRMGDWYHSYLKWEDKQHE